MSLCNIIIMQRLHTKKK